MKNYILVFLVALTLGSCSEPQNWTLDSPERIELPLVALEAWNALEACLGAPEVKLEDVQWFKVEDILNQEGSHAVGLWEKPNRIYLVAPEIRSLVHHELAHFILQSERHDSKCYQERYATP